MADLGCKKAHMHQPLVTCLWRSASFCTSFLYLNLQDLVQEWRFVHMPHRGKLTNSHFRAVTHRAGSRGGLAHSPYNGAQSHLGNLLHHTQVTPAGTTLVTCMPLYMNICNFIAVGLLHNSWWIIHSQQFCFLCCSHVLHTPLWQHTVKGARNVLPFRFSDKPIQWAQQPSLPLPCNTLAFSYFVFTSKLTKCYFNTQGIA